MVVTPAMKRRIWKSVVASSEDTFAKFSRLGTEENEFHQLPRAAMAAFNLNKYPEADELARRTLKVAESFKDNWNYGNAIHYGHTILGLLALRNGDVSLAVTELQKSGNILGSPQLGSFGPTMRLAKELLGHGRSQDVLEFLHQCHTFWRSGGRWLSIWEKKITRGVVPNFFMNLYL